MLQAIKDSIEDTKNVWATDGYGSSEQEAKGRGNVFTLMQLQAWIEGIQMEEPKEQGDGKQVRDLSDR